MYKSFKRLRSQKISTSISTTPLLTNLLNKSTNAQIIDTYETGCSSIISKGTFFEYIKTLKRDLKKKKYSQVEDEINSNEYLFISQPSFHFSFIVIKIGILLNQIEMHLNDNLLFISFSYKNKMIKQYLSKASKELNKLLLISQCNNKAHYEKIVQLNLNLLYYKALYSKRNSEYISSFSFLSIAINLMKVFLITNKYSKHPSTYINFSRNLLLLIKLLIEDNNYKDALLYEDILFNTHIKTVLLIQNNPKKQNYFSTILNNIAVCFFYRGICFEWINKKSLNAALDAYRQCKFFSCASNKRNTTFEVLSNNIIKSIFLYKENKDKLKENNNNNNYNRDKGKNYINKKFEVFKPKRAKSQKVFKLIFDKGPIMKKRFERVRSIINNNLIKGEDKGIEDKKLIDFIDVSFNFSKRKNLSPQIKNNMCHTVIYNNLLSREFKDYILTETNFEYDNPNKRDDAIGKIRKYLVSKMEMTNDYKVHSLSLKEKKIIPNLFFSLYNNYSRNKQRTPLTNKIYSYINEDITENKNRSKEKNILSKKYIDKYCYLDKKETKEFKFQKSLLDLKMNNSKYFIMNNSEYLNVDEIENEGKAVKEFNRMKNMVSKNNEEFDYLKVKAKNLYHLVFNSTSKKAGKIKMEKLLAKYRLKNTKCQGNWEEKFGNEKIYNNNIEKIRDFERDIDSLDKKIKHNKK